MVVVEGADPGEGAKMRPCRRLDSVATTRSSEFVAAAPALMNARIVETSVVVCDCGQRGTFVVSGGGPKRSSSRVIRTPRSDPHRYKIHTILRRMANAGHLCDALITEIKLV